MSIHGWLVRYSYELSFILFIASYIHIFRALYFGSYKAPRELVFIFGMLMFLLMMGTAFLGYTLPWGQMSYWGATVITNLFSAIPLVGDAILLTLLGDFTVSDATVNSILCTSLVASFCNCWPSSIHVILCIMTGHNNPTGMEPQKLG